MSSQGLQAMFVCIIDAPVPSICIYDTWALLTLAAAYFGSVRNRHTCSSACCL